MKKESKIIEIKIQPIKAALEDFARTLEKAGKGEKIKPRSIIGFESIDGLRNVLTNRRMELLSAVKHKKPRSVYQLSKLLNRDIKSVNTDLKVLKESKFIEFQKVDEKRKRTVPIVNFDDIKITVTV